ncbi:MAG: PaaI family thioesterase [Actinomycetia bacterium]|nr:PaaI family thioesterase [Actinomycetes bacterium]
MSEFLDHLGIHESTTETGRPGHDAGLAVTTDATHTNTNGGVHGGLIATLLDSTMGEAVRSALEDGQSAVTVSMTVTYLRGAEEGDELRASAELRKRGGSLAMVEADVVTADDEEPIAHGVATFSIIDAG